ncbi:MAG: helix-turn-helix domain-containing protein [Thermonemataceae bacterium]
MYIKEALLREGTYKCIKELAHQNQTVYLVITHQNDVKQRAQYTYFQFQDLPTSSTTKALLLGFDGGSYGEYEKREEEVVFKEIGYLTDTLSCTMAWHITKELQAGRKADTRHLKCMATSLMSYLVKRYHELQIHLDQEDKARLSNFKLRKIEAYIKARRSFAITITELAALTGYSPFYFTRLFKQSTGETPYRFISRSKINQAKDLLLTTNQKVIQVGMEVGFDDPSHFARAFKKITGLTPTEFRKQSYNDTAPIY